MWPLDVYRELARNVEMGALLGENHKYKGYILLHLVVWWRWELMVGGSNLQLLVKLQVWPTHHQFSPVIPEQLQVDPYTRVVLHIDTTDITEIDICPPRVISILWYPSHRYVSMSWFSGFAQTIWQKNTADTLWHARMIIKSPRYTGGDFMFLYRFVRRRRPQILVHAKTFEQPLGYLSFLAQLLALAYRLTD